MHNTNTTQLWPEAFQPTAQFPEVLQKNARGYWTSQREHLDAMHAFAEGWFQRRQAGTRVALEACESMCTARMPSEWIVAYQRWWIGSIELLVADGLACQSDVRKLSDVLGPSLVPSACHEQDDGPREDEKPDRPGRRKPRRIANSSGRNKASSKHVRLLSGSTHQSRATR
jgi:hypothetical protein